MRNDETGEENNALNIATTELEDGTASTTMPPKPKSGARAIFWKFAKDIFFAYSAVLILALFAVGSKYVVSYLENSGFDDLIVLSGVRVLFYFIFIVDVVLAMIVTGIMGIVLVREILR